MRKPFGCLPSGDQATLYTIKNETITVSITDYGATLVSLWVPDKAGCLADVVLGYDDVSGYIINDGYIGATIGRNCNRIKGAQFTLGNTTVKLAAYDNGNSLHSMPNGFNNRLWQVESHTQKQITFFLRSPDGDQGFPGNADIRVTYSVEDPASLAVTFHAISDADTVFNFTNHSFFNLAGHDQPHMAMKQVLTLPGDIFTPADEKSIPTGEERSVAGTPMDFRAGKPIGQDIDTDYEPLKFQLGYDHNFAVSEGVAAVLFDPSSGRRMTVRTDCPGVHFYSGNYLEGYLGKCGAIYAKRSGICLETQFYPDAVHHSHWQQPITKANVPYSSQTKFIFE